MPQLKKTKILIILYYFHPYISGLSLLARSLAEGLVARGHAVTVLTSQYDKSLPLHEEVNGVSVVRAKVLTKAGKGVVSLDLLKKIVQLSRLHDVVNPHLPMAHFGLVLPFIDAGKLVPQYHCDLNLGRGVFMRLIESAAYWSMGRTLANSVAIIVITKDYFSNCRFARYADRAKEIYPPIDQKRFGRCTFTDLKKGLGIAGSPYLIGFVGRIVAEKGLEYLLQAIPHLEERGKDCLVLIAGDYTRIAGGSVKDSIDQLARQYPGRVKFIGHLRFEDLVRFYNLIDVLVLPSVDPLEAFGMVQVEAMLCGTPVIATDMPGVREVIQKTGYGKLVQKRNAKDISEKICELMEKPLVLPDQALAEFSQEVSLDKYEKIFQDCMAS